MLSEYYAPIVYGVFVMMPVLFPKFFWNIKTNETVKVLYYDVKKSGENPYSDGPAALSLFDPDDETHLEIDDIHDDDEYNTLCSWLTKTCNKHTHCFFVTYNENNNETCFKLMLEDVIEDLSTKVHFWDIKNMFYVLNPDITKVTYDGLLTSYQILDLECRAIEYCMLFNKLIHEYDPDIKNNMSKLMPLANEINPLSSSQ